MLPFYIQQKFGSICKYEQRPYPNTQEYLLNNFVVLEIRNEKRDGYKKDWYEFIGHLHYVQDNFLVTTRFYEIDDLKILSLLESYLEIYQRKANINLCLDSVIPAIKQLGFFLVKYKQYQKHDFDLLGNLMMTKNGTFVFNDPLIG